MGLPAVALPDVAIDRAAALRRARTEGKAAFLEILKLPPRLTGSEWADAHRWVSADSGAAEPGQWSTDRVPYMREPMDTITGRDYQDVTIVACSQSSKTEVLLNTTGYYIDQEPSPILYVAYSVEMAEDWSKNRLAPMLRDTPPLRGKVKDPRARDSGNTILMKSYPGGYIAIVGANSAAGLASRPMRIALFDEIDRYPPSAGTEGDPIALGRARLATFRHRAKEVKVSSPGNEGESRIQKEWEKSDQRHFYVPCPHCDEYQPLEWRSSEGKYGISLDPKGEPRLVWDKVLADDGKTVIHKPETAAYLCRKCAAFIPQTFKLWMLARGRWVKHNPMSKKAGFHVNGLMSPWNDWRALAQGWLDAKSDPQQRKTFINTKLGYLYAEAGDLADPSKLTGRREAWTCDVPRGVGAVTMAIDVQGDRIEALVMGWGKDEESWLLHYERLYGDPEGADVWERAQAILNQEWTHQNSAPMRICACAVDSGYKQDAVFRWVEPKQMRGVIATKGSEELKVPLSRAQRGNRDKVRLFSFNTTSFKEVLFARLRRFMPGPGYIHIGSEEKTGVSEEFLMQFGAEKRVWERGKVRFIELPGRRNEAIDLYNNNLVALRSRGAMFIKHLDKRAADVEEEGEALKNRDPEEQTVVKPPKPSFVNAWKFR